VHTVFARYVAEGEKPVFSTRCLSIQDGGSHVDTSGNPLSSAYILGGNRHHSMASAGVNTLYVGVATTAEDVDVWTWAGV
jgi:hypothetical protein